VLILLWVFGLDDLTRDSGDVANFTIVLTVIWLITWRAWPAVEITWEFFTSPAAKRAYRPTWSHVLGALGLGLGLTLLPALFLLTVSRNIEANLGGLGLRLLLYSLGFYIAWPAMVVRWRRLRTRSA
jgi:hypothetical protein